MKSSTVKKIAIFTILFTIFLSGSFAEAKKKKANKNPTFIVYMNEDKTDTYSDYACFSIIEGESSGMTSYTVDRYEGSSQALMVMEFGSYTIEGSKITIKAGKYEFVGEMTDDKIIIDGKEYLKQETKS